MTTEHNPRRLPLVVLAALGVVYGDIGTSPLYALKEAFNEHYGIALTPANVLGILSIIVWSLLLIVSVKYLTFILRADNRGAGGILSMLALLMRDGMPGRRRGGMLVALGLFGAALLYGDGVITPAISVLSAVEGLDLVAPGVSRFVVPITIVILIGLFLIQHRGTARMGGLFGPVTLTWFLAIAATGIGG
ncbi:MAG: KUP/HAK/KT family potassium transporter, partial [Gemmatimonadota bacterium]